MSASLDLYRVLIPHHADEDAVAIEAYLGIAAASLSASAFNAQYQNACIFLAAHLVQRFVVDDCAGDQRAVGQLTAKGSEASNEGWSALAGTTIEEQELATTRYGARFLSIRASRSASGPILLRVDA